MTQLGNLGYILSFVLSCILDESCFTNVPRRKGVLSLRALRKGILEVFVYDMGFNHMTHRPDLAQGVMSSGLQDRGGGWEFRG